MKERIKNLVKTFAHLTAVFCFFMTAIELLEHLGERRRERYRRERAKQLLVILGWITVAVAASTVAVCLLIRQLKKRADGYLWDIFDREDYDVISPEEEGEFESTIKQTLSKDDEDAPTVRIDEIPLDEETTEADYS